MKIQFTFFFAILVLLANAHHLQSCRTMKDDQRKWSMLIQQSLQRAPVPPSTRDGDTNIPVPLGQQAFAGKSTVPPAFPDPDNLEVPSGVALKTNFMC
ncbi:hypothetical protein E5676_scaffold63958G00010 [Cucumis melo var. makuwa]|uniref:Uncharacterized protein n=2 Tax=Cucumis melo TaxID=3656 RepID=A0A5D3B777_CUCMM|nr:hypothetical protein E6C27_scaffold1204G00600 [Cucumis melo var. makuwa]TYJ95702.1 hypothetical protein E5676_scaffold63958G00010 [Cucumis melo var. makuwa]